MNIPKLIDDAARLEEEIRLHDAECLSARAVSEKVKMSGVAAVAAGSESEAVSAMRREVRDAWSAARDADGQTAAFRILERMVERIGYGRYDNPPLIPNIPVSQPGEHYSRKESQ